MPDEIAFCNGTPQSAQETAPDGNGLINFYDCAAFEGWHDGENERVPQTAETVREYSDLFEQYGATMSWMKEI
jgi:hypothetical protein